MEIKIAPSWKTFLASEFTKDYFQKLTVFVRSEYQTTLVCPPGPLIFHAFNSCPVDQVKVVIIGQDPYHTKGVANGLAFSASEGQRIPPSLQNIYKEIKADLGNDLPTSPDLNRWAKQGVLLLNATLTVRQGLAGSHQKHGWEKFTDAAISKLSGSRQNLVFILWGAYARGKKELIDSKKHLVLESAHPSPFSANNGFFGCKHFSKANAYLKAHNQAVIDW